MITTLMLLLGTNDPDEPIPPMAPDRYAYTDKDGIAHFVVDYRKHPEPRPKGYKATYFYVVYNTTTKDHPGRYVLRRQVARAMRVDIDDQPLAVDPSLEEVKKLIPKEATLLGRSHRDDPVILETWCQ
jgi:hypothetical protein